MVQTPIQDDFDVIPLDAKPTDIPQIDLRKLHAEGKVKIDTDMTWTAKRYPKCKPEAAFDGKAVRGYAAHRPERSGSAVYTLTFDREMDIGAVGLCLKPQYLERAELYVLRDGKFEEPEFALEEVSQPAKLTYRRFRTPIRTSAVQLKLYDRTGNWQSLYEIELFGK